MGRTVMVFCLVLCVMEEKAVVGWLQQRWRGPKWSTSYNRESGTAWHVPGTPSTPVSPTPSQNPAATAAH